MYDFHIGGRKKMGDRIKRVQNFRGLTQKELGLALGFDEKSADVRIAFNARLLDGFFKEWQLRKKNWQMGRSVNKNITSGN
jgi:hypothetical protein